MSHARADGRTLDTVIGEIGRIKADARENGMKLIFSDL